MNSKDSHRSPRAAPFTVFALGLIALLEVFMETAQGAPEPAASPVAFQAQAESRVRITGHATLGNWECESKEILATIHPGAAWIALAQAVSQGANITASRVKNLPAPHALITIPVASLQCSKPGMREGVLQALRQDDAPLIVFVLTGISDVNVSSLSGPELGRYRVIAHGDLVLAGRLRPIELAADVVQESASRLRLDAVKALRMSDFGIVPPTGLFGLIRTEDSVSVTFHLWFERVSPPIPVAAVARIP